MFTDKSNPHGDKGVLEQTVDKLSSTLTKFINAQLVSSLLLLICMFSAVIICNVESTKIYYDYFITAPFGVTFDGLVIDTNLHDFLNEFLLPVFFFVLGLEIKREFVVGELSELSKFSYVLFCALGGIIFPIITYALINYSNTDTANGWAMPMATDTALAIGVLYLFKNKISSKVFTLIASLAVIDDILSLLVIALFYSQHFFLTPFLIVLAILLLLALTNLSGFRHPLIYLFLGLLLLVFIEKSGLHGTIAGVLLAMFVPARPKKKPKAALTKMRGLLNNFEESYDTEKHLLEEVKSHKILEGVKDVSLEATTPLVRWENILELPVLVFILPLFVLTNGGFHIDFDNIASIFSSQLFWGVFLGLVVAKPFGILITSWFVQKVNLATKPEDISVSDVIIVAFVAGIGYTMSLFISELAFSSADIINMAKLAIFISALFSLLIAIIIISNKNKWIFPCAYWSKNNADIDLV